MDLATFDAWIDGAAPITHRVTLYQRGDLIAEIDALDEQIKTAEAAGDTERGMNDASPDTLRLKRAELAQSWADSALHLSVRPPTVKRADEMREAVKRAEKLDDEQAAMHVLAASVVRVETAAGDALDLPDGMSLERLNRLIDKVGEAQAQRLSRTYFEALTQVPDLDPTN